MNHQNQSPRRPPTGTPSHRDPSQYDMYATFRTKERANLERRRQSGEQSLYDSYRDRANAERANAERTHAQNPNARASSAQTHSAQTQNRNGRRNSAVYPDSPMSVYGRSGQNPASRGTAGQQNSRQGTAQQTATRQNTTRQSTARQNTARKSSSKQNSTSGYGTRVQSAAGDAYRYGFHSSYRTSDGRILDGFDKTGRPIYRDPYVSSDDVMADAGVILHSGAAIRNGEHRLRPVRRARIVTLDDTEKKPFPIRIVATVLFCTVMVMAVLYSYMELNEQTNRLSTLSYQLSALKSETNTLQAEVVRREDLISIEQTAADILGMVKTDVLTKQYVSIENEDKTEVVANLEEEAIRRVTVEIDLSTGKPIEKTDDRATSYTPAADVDTEAVTEPVTETAAEVSETETETAEETNPA